MIAVAGLTKCYGQTMALGYFSFEGGPGLGRPTSGTARQRPRYVDLPAPLPEVGALLDADAAPVQNGRAHLRSQRSAKPSRSPLPLPPSPRGAPRISDPAEEGAAGPVSGAEQRWRASLGT